MDNNETPHETDSVVTYYPPVIGKGVRDYTCNIIKEERMKFFKKTLDSRF